LAYHRIVAVQSFARLRKQGGTLDISKLLLTDECLRSSSAAC
jgi:hypothetical protein